MNKKVLISVIVALVLIIGGIYAANVISDKKAPEKEAVSDTVADTKTEDKNTDKTETNTAKEESKDTKNNSSDAKSEDKNTQSATSNQKSEDAPVTIESEKAEPEKVYTPTFMYFISDSDENFDKTNKTIEELKKEYNGKVTFDIVNIDKNPEAKDNFPVENQTPALIMLNTSNDISAFEFKCSDKEKLKASIEAALNK